MPYKRRRTRSPRDLGKAHIDPSHDVSPARTPRAVPVRRRSRKTPEDPPRTGSSNQQTSKQANKHIQTPDKGDHSTSYGNREGMRQKNASKWKCKRQSKSVATNCHDIVPGFLRHLRRGGGQRSGKVRGDRRVTNYWINYGAAIGDGPHGET